MNKEYIFLIISAPVGYRKIFVSLIQCKGTTSVYRDVYGHDMFLHPYISVALLSCSDSETFSSELILVQVQLLSLSESFEAKFKV